MNTRKMNSPRARGVVWFRDEHVSHVQVLLVGSSSPIRHRVLHTEHGIRGIV